ncbi:MAG: hypothetical protein H6733_01885 [Alphaproteobacteria bacterium]|nr:hypothetical protein [Alphaproteobacteria bacterium]
MRRSLTSLIELALVGATLSLASCTEEPAADGDCTADDTDTDCEQGCPEQGCPEQGCPEQGCPEAGCPT